MNIDEYRRRVAAAIQATAAIGEAICGFGERGIPSGELYAHICDKMSLEDYQAVIGLLKRTGLVTESNHVLKASSALLAKGQS